MDMFKGSITGQEENDTATKENTGLKANYITELDTLSLHICPDLEPVNAALT